MALLLNYAAHSIKPMKSSKIKNELITLMNVGKATYHDLQLLNIDSISELAKASPDELYSKLQILTGKTHDPCVWDIFAAAIHEARTGEKTPWWEWTKIRKRKQF